jgi:PAS domain S-box-containing protein
MGNGRGLDVVLPKVSPRSPAARWMLAVVLPAAGAALALVLEPLLGLMPLIVPLTAVALSALVSGRGAGLLSAVVGAVVVVFALLEPRFSLGLATSQDALLGALFLATASMLAVMCGSVRERHDAEQAARLALLERDRLLEIVFAQMPAGQVLVSPTGTMISCNAKARELLGRPLHDVQSISDFTGVIDGQGNCVPPQQTSLALAMRERRVIVREALYRRPDGRVLSMQVTATPIINARGELVAGMALFRDVTADKEIDRARLQAAEAERARLFELLKRAPALIRVTEGPEHRVVFANDEYKRMLLPSGVEIEGKTVLEAFPGGAARDHVVRILDQVYRTGESASAMAAPYRQEGQEGSDGKVVERFFNVTMQAVRGAQGKVTGTLGVMIDVTEQVRAQHAVEAARAEAEAANRTKDEFLAMLGHELRNPLAPIVTALHLIQMRGGQTFQRELSILERQVAHLARLVDDLLDIARITRGNVALVRRPVEIGAVVHKAVETVGPLVEDRAQHLDVHVPPSGLLVDGDDGRLAQVIGNLLTNASKYTARGGDISIDARRAADEVEVRVRDSGKGIAPEMLPRIFEPFVQGDQSLDRARGGLGLGLAIARTLVTMHGGRIQARSEGPGRGSEFTIDLPPAPQVPAPAPSISAGARSQLGPGQRVLVVDDNKDAADSMADLLADRGHTVRVAYDGAEALERLRTFTPDVALVDIGLPVMDGYELARRLRADPGWRTIRLIAVTGYGQPSDRAQTEAAGFEAHLVKPVDPDILETVMAHRPRVTGGAQDAHA